MHNTLFEMRNITVVLVPVGQQLSPLMQAYGQLPVQSVGIIHRHPIILLTSTPDMLPDSDCNEQYNHCWQHLRCTSYRPGLHKVLLLQRATSEVVSWDNLDELPSPTVAARQTVAYTETDNASKLTH